MTLGHSTSRSSAVASAVSRMSFVRRWTSSRVASAVTLALMSIVKTTPQQWELGRACSRRSQNTILAWHCPTSHYGAVLEAFQDHCIGYPASSACWNRWPCKAAISFLWSGSPNLKMDPAAINVVDNNYTRKYCTDVRTGLKGEYKFEGVRPLAGVGAKGSCLLDWRWVQKKRNFQNQFWVCNMT